LWNITLTHTKRPGLRERFVFHQHRYCSNRFWKRLAVDFRILWPFEFSDCYSHNLTTGTYKFSPAFQDTIGDIRAWTMTADLFKAYPEFLSDIPVYDSMPLSPSSPFTPKQHKLAHSDNSNWALVPSGGEIENDFERQSHDYHHHNSVAISRTLDTVQDPGLLSECGLDHHYDTMGNIIFPPTTARGWGHAHSMNAHPMIELPSQ
jgi:hypothetical protein